MRFDKDSLGIGSELSKRVCKQARLGKDLFKTYHAEGGFEILNSSLHGYLFNQPSEDPQGHGNV